MMEEGESMLDDSHMNCEYADNDDNKLHVSSTSFVDSMSNSVPELPFVKHHEDTIMLVKSDYHQTFADDRLAVATVSGSDDAQLELAVEDDGMVVGGDEELGHEDRIRADVEDDDRAYMYVTSAGDTRTFNDHLLPPENMFSKNLEIHGPEITRNEEKGQAIFRQVSQVYTNSDPQPLTVTSSTEPSSVSASHPLGSSKNPIRIIQQGNKYTSMQELTHDQLSQIMQVIQQQQLISSNKASSVLYNPATQTKIVYRVVYPPDIHKGGRSVAASAAGKSNYRRKMVRDDADSDSDKKSREDKRKRIPRTRSGRKCRPPSYMVKDYKHIHPVDFDVNDNDNSDGGYSDFRESSEEGEEAGYGASEDLGDGDGTMMSKVSDDSTVQYAASGKPKSFKCSICNKCYVGRGGLARHFRLQPTHGQIEDLPEAGNSSDSFQSGSMSSSTPGPATSSSAVTATTFSGMIKPSLTSDMSPTNGVDISENCALLDSKTTSILEESSDATLDQSGATDPNIDIAPSALPKRRRGRPPAPHHLQTERRKEKLRELVMQCSSDELAEVIFPCLVPSLTLWQYLSLRADAVSRSSYDGGVMSAADKSLDNVDLAVMLDEYATLHREVQNMCNQKLEVGHVEKKIEDASRCEHDPIQSELSLEKLVDNASRCEHDPIQSELSLEKLVDNASRCEHDPIQSELSLEKLVDNASRCEHDPIQSELSLEKLVDNASRCEHDPIQSELSLEKLVDNASRCEHDPIQSESDGLVNNVLVLPNTSTLDDSSSNNETDNHHVSDDLEANRTDVLNCRSPRADEVICVDTAGIGAIENSVVNNVQKLIVDASDADDIACAGDVTSGSAESSTDVTVKHSESAIDQVQVGSNCNSNNKEETLLSVKVENGLSSSPQTKSSVPAAVVLDSDALKISSKELAHCLGLTVGVRYRVKEQLVLPSQKASSLDAEDDVLSATAAATDHVEETAEPRVLASPTLPPRKRLKLSQSSVVSAVDSMALATLSVTNSAQRTINTSNISTPQVLQSSELVRKVVMASAVVPSRHSVMDDGRQSLNSGNNLLAPREVGLPRSVNGNRQKMLIPSSSSRVLQPPSGTVSMARHPNHVVAVRAGGQPVARASSLASKRGRRSQQMMSVLRPDVLNRATVQQPLVSDSKEILATLLQEQQQQQMANAVMYDPTAVSAGYSVSQPVPAAYVGSSSVSNSMPGVIHIDENAKVMQTDDGMIIVCNPDGTIQIHGHTEGQPIPLDAVKALLGLDEMQHTLVAVNEGGDQTSGGSTTLDANQHTAMLNLDVNNQAMMQVDPTTQALFGVCAGGQSLMTLDGRQTLVSMDGTQSYLTVDGNGQTLVTVDGQALVGMDPSQAATLVTLDGGQTYMALDVGHTLISMDGGQNAAMVGIDGQELIGIAGGQSML